MIGRNDVPVVHDNRQIPLHATGDVWPGQDDHQRPWQADRVARGTRPLGSHSTHAKLSENESITLGFDDRMLHHIREQREAVARARQDCQDVQFTFMPNVGDDDGNHITYDRKHI